VILAAACIAGFAVACAAGAKPRLLLDVPLRWTGLVVVALALQLALFAVHLRPPAPLSVSDLHLASYVLLVLFGLRNRRVPGFALAIGGLACNTLVIFVNGGRMPVAPSASLDGTGATLTGIHDNVVALTASSHLHFLADVFALPHPFPLANTFSVGDVLLVAGVTLFVYTNGRAAGDRATSTALEPIRVPAFRLLLTARMVSKLGDWISTAALVTWIYAHSHSTIGVSAILLARLTASIGGSLVSGAVLQRGDRFRLLARVEGARGLATLGAVAAVAFAQPLLVGAFVFLSAFLAAATDPTASSLVAEVLPAERLHAGNALHALSRALVMAVGATTGGLLAASVGAVPALLADTVTFAAAVALYGTWARRHAPAVATTAQDAAGPDLDGRGREQPGRLEAFTVICRSRRLGGLVAAFTVATVAMGVLNASLPSFLSSRAPHAGGYGVAIGVIAVGLICGEYLSGRAARRVVERIPALGFALAAVVAGVAAASHSPATIMLLLFFLGMSDGTTETAYDTVVQAEAPESSVDRVFAVAGAVQQSGMILGFLIAPLLQHPGPVVTFRVSAFGFALAALVAVLITRRPERDAWAGRALAGEPQ
jgi:MFS family permease